MTISAKQYQPEAVAQERVKTTIDLVTFLTSTGDK